MSDLHASIESSQIFEPVTVDDEDSWIVWVNIHGTEISVNSIKLDAVNTADFEQLKDIAASYAKIKKKKLKFLTFRWSGKNNCPDRTYSAGCLYFYLKKMGYCNSKHEIVLAAHSHGCNLCEPCYAIHR